MGVLAPGEIVGGCRIEEVVGRGGMGIVYRARQLALDRDVAVKVIAPERTEDPIARERFVAEARAAAAVEHPSVVPIHAVGTAGDLAYLVMRFVDGDDLRALVRRAGALAPRDAAAITERLGDALDAIHRAGYVHRDVKPANVLLDGEGHVYLSDFGLAKATLARAGPATGDGWVGTSDYVAPEQIRGAAVDARTDVYSLGGVLCFMLAGRPPFARDREEATLYAHLHDAPALPGLPALDPVVARALAKDPADRQQSAGELGRAAMAAARGDAIDEPTRRSASRPVRAGRRRALVLAGLAVAAAGTALTVALGGNASKPRAPATAAAPTSRPPPARPPVTRGALYRNVGFRPRGIALAGGGVFVISHRRDRVVWIDADTGRRPKADPIGRGASAIAADGDRVWITRSTAREVVGLDARTGAEISRFPTPGRPTEIAAAKAGLWVALQEDEPGAAGILARFDRAGGLLQRREVSDGIEALATGGGAVWLTTERRERILSAEPGGELKFAATLFGPGAELTYGAGHVWTSVPQEDAVARLRPGTEQPTTSRVTGRPGPLAIARGRLVVARTTAHRIEVFARGRMRGGVSVAVPENPSAVAAGDGHLWVTSLAQDTLTRLDFAE